MTKKFVNVCLHSGYSVQIFIQFDEFSVYITATVVDLQCPKMKMICILVLEILSFLKYSTSFLARKFKYSNFTQNCFWLEYSNSQFKNPDLSVKIQSCSFNKRIPQKFMKGCVITYARCMRKKSHFFRQKKVCNGESLKKITFS